MDTDELKSDKKKNRRYVAAAVLVMTAFILFAACIHRDSGDARVADARVLTSGMVVDDSTGKPLAGAIITLDAEETLLTDENGHFQIKPTAKKVAARAFGYTRADLDLARLRPDETAELRLKPFLPKALYMTVYGIGDKKLRESALKLIDETELNSLVIDVKGDRGFIPYKSAVPLAAEIGAQKVITVKDIKGLVQSLKDKGIYTIARIVVFKDNLLGQAKPDLAVKTADGKIWRDRENLIWMDPSKKEAQEYAINIAIEAAQNGFDEIQFDYVRFPDRKGLVFGITNNEENRIKTISGFLADARKRLMPYNVFVSADIFGYVAWNLDDTQIGQKIDRLAPAVDYISLMLYPSGFQWGIPGYRNPVANTNRIVYLSLKRAHERTSLPTVRFRPWLQAFRDYAFDRRHFTGTEIREQIKAADEFGSGGCMLWNPRNVYSSDGLKKKPSTQDKTIS
ncbi:MAG TPA: putative glycoside hydrolase [Dissulfurispiraceae bacterium]|nr:putative glycoside hydrolase [Dissulfurispiraceae bacterium]